MRILNAIVLTLVIIGGLNWGIIGLFDYNVVEELLGTMPWLTKTIYVIVGLSSLWAISFYAQERRRD